MLPSSLRVLWVACVQLVCKEAAMRPLRKVFDVLEAAAEDQDTFPRLVLDAITTADVLAALETTKSSAHMHRDKYLAWEKEFGSV